MDGGPWRKSVILYFIILFSFLKFYTVSLKIILPTNETLLFKNSRVNCMRVKHEVCKKIFKKFHVPCPIIRLKLKIKWTMFFFFLFYFFIRNAKILSNLQSCLWRRNEDWESIVGLHWQKLFELCSFDRFYQSSLILVREKLTSIPLILRVLLIPVFFIFFFFIFRRACSRVFIVQNCVWFSKSPFFRLLIATFSRFLVNVSRLCTTILTHLFFF